MTCQPFVDRSVSVKGDGSPSEEAASDKSISASGIFLQEIIHAGIRGKRQKTASFFCDFKGLQLPVLAASVNAQITVQNLLKAGVFRKVQFIFLFAV